MTALKINTCIWDARVHARSSRSKPFVLGRVGPNAGLNRPVICAVQGSQPSVAGDGDSVVSLSKALREKEAEAKAEAERYKKAKAEAERYKKYVGIYFALLTTALVMYGFATGRFSFQLRQICIESLAWLAIVVGLDIMAGCSPLQSITTAMGLIPAFELTRILAKGMSLIVAGLVS